jgi:hypothetical protein
MFQERPILSRVELAASVGLPWADAIPAPQRAGGSPAVMSVRPGFLGASTKYAPTMTDEGVDSTGLDLFGMC